MTYISAANRIALFNPRVRGVASLDGMPGEDFACWLDPEDPVIPVFDLEPGLRIAHACSSVVYGVRYDALSLTFREYSDEEFGVVADCAQPCPVFVAPDGARVHAIGFWHGWAWNVTPSLN